MGEEKNGVLKHKGILKQIGNLSPGDLIRVDWFDASIGKSLTSGTEIDIPVKSWGVFVSLLGEKKKHIVLAQNCFRYTDGLYDVDYTSIPISWTVEIIIVNKGEVNPEVANLLIKSFLAGRCRTIKRRIRNHA